MKIARLLIGALALTLIGMAPPQTKPQSPDTEIKARFESFATAWNKHDSKTLAAFWTTDGDLIDPFGQAASGRAGIEKFFLNEHANEMKGTTFMITKQSARTIKPDVAIADLDISITGMKTPEGSDAPPCDHHLTVVLTKDASDWMFVAARPVIYAPKPGEHPMQ